MPLVTAGLVGLATVSAPFAVLAQESSLPAAPGGTVEEGVETLTRGPVHEAFATPTASDPAPGALVEKQPPAEIDEVAPDYRPEGAIWVPGYWEWDDARTDFIWISGLWRVSPPGMRWVPPYWTEVEGGWQRVAGFWVSADAGELEYRETPPESLEVGPTTPSPAENHFYIPGSWNYYDSGYRWRTGYWTPYRNDWVWCPQRWVWTPAGCVYTSGYWDHRPIVRGTLFAPIWFNSPIYAQAGYRYRPWCVIDTNRFFTHLWIGPRSNNYYFGNYYGGGYRGYSHWSDWSYRNNRHCYDPLWSWSNVHYRRQGIDFIDRHRGWNRYYENHVDERPRNTWREQVELVSSRNLDVRKSQNVLAADLRDYAQRDDSALKLTRLNDRDREAVRDVRDDLRKLNTERSRVEGEAKVASREGRGSGENRGAGENRGDGAGRSAANRAEDLRDRTTARTGRDAAKLKLPKVSDTARAALDSSKKAPPKLDSDPAERTGADRDNAARDLPRVGRDGGKTGRDPDGSDRSGQARTAEDRTRDARPAEAGDAAADAARAANRVGERAGRSGENTARSAEERIRDAREAAEDRTDRASRSGREAATPRVETPRVESPRTETPRERLERNNVTPGIADNLPPTNQRGRSDIERGRSDRDAAETRGRSSIDELRNRVESGRARGGADSAPRLDTPRTETPRVETRGKSRTEGPRVDVPRTETPRVETRRVETPKVETPRVEPRRTEAPRVEPRRTETPRVQPRSVQPRVETPRVEPRRVETPRPQARSVQPRANVPQSAARVQSSGSGSSRPSASRGSGGGGNKSGGGKPGKDRD